MRVDALAAQQLRQTLGALLGALVVVGKAPDWP